MGGGTSSAGRLELIELENLIKKELKVTDELIVDNGLLQTDFQQTYDYLKTKGYEVTRVTHHREDHLLKQTYNSLRVRRKD